MAFLEQKRKKEKKPPLKDESLNNKIVENWVKKIKKEERINLATIFGRREGSDVLDFRRKRVGVGKGGHSESGLNKRFEG